MICVVVFEFALIVVENGVDFFCGLFCFCLTLAFGFDEFVFWAVFGECVKFFCCEGFQEVICAGYLLESEVAFLAGDVWVKFACKFPEGGTYVFR